MFVSRSSTRDRAQTEPIAGLLAVIFIALAFSFYTGVTADLLPGQSDRNVEEGLTETVWPQIETDGAYDNGTLNTVSVIDRSTLPRAYYVYVNVTMLNSSGWVELNEVVYTPNPSTGPISMDPPEKADLTSRPIPIRMAPGNIRTGRLTIAVWKN